MPSSKPSRRSPRPARPAHRPSTAPARPERSVKGWPGRAAKPVSSLHSVFDALLSDILGGRHGPGTHLPAERDLARGLGASRATVREALRQLGSLRLIEARHGSGVVVTSVRDWSFGVLPAYLKAGAPLTPSDRYGALIAELLDLRRVMALEFLRLVAPRLGPGVPLDRIRAMMLHAWEARHDKAEFIRRDVDLLRALLETAGMLPCLWLLNGIADVYVELSRALGTHLGVPEGYLDVHLTMLRALEKGDAAVAVARMTAFLEENDRVILDVLGIERPRGGGPAASGG